VTATLSGKTATGFLFDDATLPALKRAIDRALELYNQPFT
jgi:glycogen synthase